MEAVKFVKVENPEEGIKLLLDETGSWLDELCEKYENVEWQGGHDEANFLTSFKDYYEITKSSKVLDLATKFFLAWRNSEEMDFEIKDIHHDTEHYSIFLKWYYDISKDDLAKDILIRYAEFIMENFNEKFGSNSSECVRLIKCVLNAYEVTEDRKYYEWANEKLQA